MAIPTMTTVEPSGPGGAPVGDQHPGQAEERHGAHVGHQHARHPEVTGAEEGGDQVGRGPPTTTATAARPIAAVIRERREEPATPTAGDASGSSTSGTVMVANTERPPRVDSTANCPAWPGASSRLAMRRSWFWTTTTARKARAVHRAARRAGVVAAPPSVRADGSSGRATGPAVPVPPGDLERGVPRHGDAEGPADGADDHRQAEADQEADGGFHRQAGHQAGVPVPSVEASPVEGQRPEGGPR